MSKQPDLTAFLPLGKQLSVLTKLYVGVLTKNLGYLEIERHYSLLILIDKSKDKCTQQYLSDYLKIDKASMVRIIDDFVRKNFLKRTVNPNDRREHWMELTPKAKKLMPGILKTVEELNDTSLKGLSKKQKEYFFETLSVISSNLIKEPANRVIINYKKANKQ